MTTAAREALARRFDLPYDPFAQEKASETWEVADPVAFNDFLSAYWSWEVADPSRFDEFLDAYVSDPLDDDERFALMEILIQCVEDLDLPSIESSPQWRSVADPLRSRAELHASSVRHWSFLDAGGPDERPQVSGPMRAVWEAILEAGVGSRGPASDSSPLIRHHRDGSIRPRGAPGSRIQWGFQASGSFPGKTAQATGAAQAR